MMNKKLLLLCIVIFILCLNALALAIGISIHHYGLEKITKQASLVFNIKEQSSFKPYSHWNYKVKQFETLNEPLTENSVVFLGDSITAGFLVKESNPKIQVFNRGINGDTTAGILERLDRTVLNLKPAKVFIMVGVNDIYRYSLDTDDILVNYENIIKKLREDSPNTRIYIQSVLPVGQSIEEDSPGISAVITKLNRGLKEISSIDDMIQYIEIGSLFKDKQGFLKENYSVDEIHINEQAYKIWNDLLKPYLY